MLSGILLTEVGGDAASPDTYIHIMHNQKTRDTILY